jgi:hypothetical protein
MVPKVGTLIEAFYVRATYVTYLPGLKGFAVRDGIASSLLLARVDSKGVTMDGSPIHFAFAEPSPMKVARWLPASYRAYAAQEDYRYVPGGAREQLHFIETSQEISRTKLRTRSIVVAVILALVLGPVGMLYGSEFGAFVMALLECVALLLKRLPELLAAWSIGVAWTVLAVMLHNRRHSDLE